MNRFFKMTCTLALGVSLIGVSACSMYKEGTVTPERVKVAEKNDFKEYNVSTLDQAALEDIAHNYKKYGDGDVYVTVTYDPRSREGTAMNASGHAARIVKTLGNLGMPVHADIMPVKDSVYMKALFSYDTYMAEAPDCGGTLPGLMDRDHRTDMDYKMGCSIETMLAKQVSRPKDLLGNDPTVSTTDGRGVSNQIELVRTGATNESLGGQSASN